MGARLPARSRTCGLAPDYLKTFPQFTALVLLPEGGLRLSEDRDSPNSIVGRRPMVKSGANEQ